jgi:hypothetical protein
MLLGTSNGSLPAIGVTMLGVFIGYLVWYFVVRLGGEKYTTDGLVAVVGVVAGGAVIQFLKGGGLSAHDWWWYPVGLVIGWGAFVVFHFINWLVTRNKKAPTDADKPFPALIVSQKSP